MEGGGEVILLPALGLALRLELPQALSLESLRGKGEGKTGSMYERCCLDGSVLLERQKGNERTNNSFKKLTLIDLFLCLSV